MRLPTGFLPDEDQGIAFVQVQTPPGATQGRTRDVLDDVSDYLLHDEGDAVDATFEIDGFNFAGRGQNQGLVFVRLQGLVGANACRPQGAGGAWRARRSTSRRTRMRSSFRSIRRRSPRWEPHRASISSSRIAAASATTSSSQARDQLVIAWRSRIRTSRSCAPTGSMTTRRTRSTSIARKRARSASI